MMDKAATPGAITVVNACSVCPRRITYSWNMLVNIRANYAGTTDEFWCDMDNLRCFGRDIFLKSFSFASDTFHML